MPDDLVNRNVDHIFDVTEDDGQVTRIAYSGIITRIVKKHKDLMQTLFEIVYDSFIIMMMKKTYEYALLQNYYKGNLLILN